MGPLEAMVFLDASCYFWTRRGISARVHNERAAGRAGGRTGWQSYFWTRLRAGGRAGGQGAEIISGHVPGRAGGRADRLAKLFLDTFPGGRAGGRTGWQSYFWTRSRAGRAGGRADRLAKLFLDTFPGGRAGGQAGKVISGHVPGRAGGGRTGWQSYLWTRSRAGGRAGGQAGKVISGHVPGRAGGRTGWQSYFWTRSRAGGRAGGQAGKVISGHVPGRAGGRADRLANYFWTRSRAGGRADRLAKLFLDTFPGGRAGGRTGWQSYFWTRLQENYFWAPLWAGGRAGGQACKINSGHVPGRAGGQAGKVISGILSLEKLERPRTKCSFWKLVARKIGEASHETLVLEACCLKSWGSLARNARFGSLLLEKFRRPRTKCSFWKLVAWKVAEASHEMLVLEACRLKSCGGLARNPRFGSLLLEKLRGPRTKCSFWKLVAWKVEEASHEMLVLEACRLKSCGGLARNARFGNLLIEKLKRPGIGEAARCTGVL